MRKAPSTYLNNASAYFVSTSNERGCIQCPFGFLSCYVITGMGSRACRWFRMMERRQTLHPKTVSCLVCRWCSVQGGILHLTTAGTCCRACRWCRTTGRRRCACSLPPPCRRWRPRGCGCWRCSGPPPPPLLPRLTRPASGKLRHRWIPFSARSR